MLTFFLPLLLLAQGAATPGTLTNAELTNLLAASCTNSAYTGLSIPKWQALARTCDKRFDTLLDDLSRQPGESKVLLDDELAAIGRDRREHPEKYTLIEDTYMYHNAAPGARAPRPRRVLAEHVTPEYRYACEYFFMRPASGHEVTGFQGLCSECIDQILGQEGASWFFYQFGLTIASTPEVGDGIDRLVLESLSQIHRQRSVESLGRLLTLGQVWNVHHDNASVEGNPYEEHLARDLYSNTPSSISSGWQDIWAQVGSLRLSSSEEIIVKRVRAMVVKEDARLAAKQAGSTHP